MIFIQGPAYADQTIQLARESPSVYIALRKVLTMMEAGKLKGQKEGSGNEGKIHHYKVFQGLQVGDICVLLEPRAQHHCTYVSYNTLSIKLAQDTQKSSLLHRLINQELTFAEVKKVASNTKEKKKKETKLEPIKDVLSETTGLEFAAIASYDSEVEDKLLDFVDKMDPQNPSEEFKVYIMFIYYEVHVH